MLLCCLQKFASCLHKNILQQFSLDWCCRFPCVWFSIQSVVLTLEMLTVSMVINSVFTIWVMNLIILDMFLPCLLVMENLVNHWIIIIACGMACMGSILLISGITEPTKLYLNNNNYYKLKILTFTCPNSTLTCWSNVKMLSILKIEAKYDPYLQWQRVSYRPCTKPWVVWILKQLQ